MISLCLFPPGGGFNKKRRDCPQHRLFQNLLKAHVGKSGGTRRSAQKIVSYFPGGIFYQHPDGTVTPMEEKRAILIISQKIRDTRKKLRRSLMSNEETVQSIAEEYATKTKPDEEAAAGVNIANNLMNALGDQGVPDDQKQGKTEELSECGQAFFHPLVHNLPLLAYSPIFLVVIEVPSTEKSDNEVEHPNEEGEFCKFVL